MHYDKNQLLKIAAVLLCLFLFSGMLSGCSDQSAPKSSGQYDDIVNEINEVQVRIEQEYLLTKASPEERDSVLEGLRLIQNGFSKLNSDPNDVMSVKIIDRGIGLLERFDRQERDFPVLRPLIWRAGAELLKVAERLGVELSFRFPVYQTEFSEFDLPENGFLMFPEGSWSTRQVINGIRQLATFSTSRGQVEHSWLILPAMDLSNIKRLAFRLEHGISLSRGDNSAVFNKLLFQQKSFKVKVSTTYVGRTEEPWEMKDCELIESPEGSGQFRVERMGSECDWMTYDVEATKMQTDRFFQRFSSIIELDEFREKNVSIAFVFDQSPMLYDPRSCRGYYSANTCTRKLDQPKELGGHRVSWDLHSFELIGSGEVGFPKDVRKQEEELLAHSFASSRVEAHKNLLDLSYNKGDQNWLPGGKAGPPMLWVKIESKAGYPKSAGLISPVYDLSEVEELKWSIRENIRWDWPKEIPLSFDSTEILYSYDYEGGDVLTATWEKVERKKPASRFKRSDWGNNYTVSGIELDPRLTGRVTFLFWMHSNRKMTWQVENYKLRGIGEAIGTLDYTSEPAIGGPWREGEDEEVPEAEWEAR